MASVQCRTVKISILGDEGVPVQVDGEAWIQPPGYIRIVHKNRAQTLTRDRVRAIANKAWWEWGCLGYQWLIQGLTCTFIKETKGFHLCSGISLHHKEIS